MTTNPYDANQPLAEFVRKHGVACGGNWAAMLMSAIRSGLPDEFAKLDDGRSYTLAELAAIIEANLPLSEI